MSKAQNTAPSRRTARSPARGRDGFVLTAISLISFAAAIALYVQLDFSILQALLCAALLYLALVATHVAHRRGQIAVGLKAEIDRLRSEGGPNGERGRPIDPARGPAPGVDPTLAMDPARAAPVEPGEAASRSRSPRGGAAAHKQRPVAPQEHTVPDDVRTARGAPRSPVAAVAQPYSGHEINAAPPPPAQHAQQYAAPAQASPVTAPSMLAPPVLANAWQHRPGTLREPTLGGGLHGSGGEMHGGASGYANGATGAILTAIPEEMDARAAERAPAPAALGQRMGGSPTAASGPAEEELTSIQTLIKRLANDLNSPRRPEPPELAGSNGSVGPPTRSLEIGATLTRGNYRRMDDDRIARSVEALRTTAGLMRAALPPEAAEPDAPVEQMPEPAHAAALAQAAPSLAAGIADSVFANRFSVYVEPVLGLADRRARHFEVSVRLLLAHGQELDPAGLDPDALDPHLLPRIDAAKILRTAAFAERLLARGKSASVQSSISAPSLTDDAFIDELAASVGGREELARHLVLSFTQNDVRHFSAAHWEAVRVMAELGLRFALEDVVDLDMDFETLKATGFVFVKLDAGVLADGLPATGMVVPPADLCRYLSGIGLGLIVGHIDDEAMLARVLGFGALLGQGTLFGGPRPIRVETPGVAQVAAA